MAGKNREKEREKDRLYSLDFETDVPPEEEDYSLEEILTEYGGGLEWKLSKGTPEAGAEEADGKRRGLFRFVPGVSTLKGKLGGSPEDTPGNSAGERTDAPSGTRTDEPSGSWTDGEGRSGGPAASGEPSADPEPSGGRTALPPVRLADIKAGFRKLRDLLARGAGRAAVGVRRALGSVAGGVEKLLSLIPAAEDWLDRMGQERRPRRRGAPVPVPAPSRLKKKRSREKETAPPDGETVETETAEAVNAGAAETETAEAVNAEAAETETAQAVEAETVEAETVEAETAGTETAEPEAPETADGETAGAEQTEEAPVETVEAGDEASAEAESIEREFAREQIPAEETTGEEPAEEPAAAADGPSEPAGPEDNTAGGPVDAADRPADTAGSPADAAARKQPPRWRRRLSFRSWRAGQEPVGPEIPLKEAASRFREAYTRRQVPPLALASAGVPLLLLLIESTGISVPLLTTVIPLRCLVTLFCLGATAYFCRQVFTGSPAAFVCGVSAAAAGCDCLLRMFLSVRSAGDTYGAAACLGMVLAQWGVSLESRGRYDTFRAASVDDDPPYLVTDMDQGACKQRGATPGFYSTAMIRDRCSVWQAVLLPLTLAVSVVFAVLSSFGRERPADFFLNWSAILTAGATFTLPLCWGLPWSRLARRLQKAGGALAGWAGAEKISRHRTMIVTDADLFPPGSVQLNGIRLFGEGMDKAVLYAAAMTKAASCELERVFDELLHSELGEDAESAEAEEFNFYEEGGYGAVVNGDTVLMGTAAFLRRMGVLLPRDVRIPTGMCLAVDHRLLAVFAIRYNAADNVDYALRLMRRSRVTPVLAVRDPNVTPALLRRKFRRKIPARYPDLARRIALSEVEFDRDAPRALLFREGLLPYAEIVVGSRRLCGGVRRAAILGELGGYAGMLLTFYLAFQGKYELMPPLSLIGFLLLWLLPALLVMELF